MALQMKLDNVTINKGKFVYIRRIPTDLKHHFPKRDGGPFQCGWISQAPRNNRLKTKSVRLSQLF